MLATTTILTNPPPSMLTRKCIPPTTPPPGKPASWMWTCERCKISYKLAVTRRCLHCDSTRLLRNVKSIGASITKASIRRRRLDRLRRIPVAENHDYDFWSVQNDWRRFRSIYMADPEAWKRRTMRDLAGSSGAVRRAKKFEIETNRRTEITQDRFQRMLNCTHSCESDCDYPSQCHTERYQVFQKNPNMVAGHVEIFAPTYDEDEEDQGKLPLCGLLPEFDQEMTSPEDIDDQDEILAAYEAKEQDEWFAAPRSSSDDENEDTTSQNFEEMVQDDDHEDKDEWFDATSHLSED
ncbi:uncharacterized protein FTOL_01033 [Fusarium torulosum]|uniref:Uncharacterized protein n=1 Tax=Fusarium torulosum TaxID=33205 RepID=A0AAE8LZG0_9HYPO|nr:uncharacterized protein FTOL_01033 [Fusarium torulosum]